MIVHDTLSLKGTSRIPVVIHTPSDAMILNGPVEIDIQVEIELNGPQLSAVQASINVSTTGDATFSGPCPRAFFGRIDTFGALRITAGQLHKTINVVGAGALLVLWPVGDELRVISDLIVTGGGQLQIVLPVRTVTKFVFCGRIVVEDSNSYFRIEQPAHDFPQLLILDAAHWTIHGKLVFQSNALQVIMAMTSTIEIATGGFLETNAPVVFDFLMGDNTFSTLALSGHLKDTTEIEVRCCWVDHSEEPLPVGVLLCMQRDDCPDEMPSPPWPTDNCSLVPNPTQLTV